MALVKCPACGKMVSENASSCPSCGEPIAAKMSGQVESGTENFSVQAGNRLELTAKTQAEISARTNRLSSEGKTVVSVNTSVPQPFSVGVTVWRNDVTIVWNANLGSEQYKSHLYAQGKQFYQSGQYNKALELFNKINGYSDSRSLASQCRDRIDAQNRANYQAAREAADIQKVAGKDPTFALIVCGFFGACFLLFGFLSLAQYGKDPKEYSEDLTWAIWLLIIACALIIPQIIRKKKYDNAVAKYKWSKK